MTDPTCGNCNAFLANAAANPKSGQARQGWCRARSPAVVPVTGPMPATFGAWPTTDAKQWCREHRPSEDSTP